MPGEPLAGTEGHLRGGHEVIAGDEPQPEAFAPLGLGGMAVVRGEVGEHRAAFAAAHDLLVDASSVEVQRSSTFVPRGQRSHSRSMASSATATQPSVQSPSGMGSPFGAPWMPI